MEKTKSKFNKEMIIGDVVAMGPEAESVIKKYFGNGCFTCPGMKMESLSFGAMMHGLDPDAVVSELNQI
ncbi:MAG: DUF1858 domain-containing protein [Dehalococcoidia bacterium]|nr:DUF1858 domain-containing protein [Dehalococcoidia bacterium]